MKTPNELLAWRRQLHEEIGALGFAYGPDADVNGGDAVEYLGKLYDDLGQMIEEPLASLLQEALDHMNATLPYFPSDAHREGEETLVARIEAALRRGTS